MGQAYYIFGDRWLQTLEISNLPPFSSIFASALAPHLAGEK